MLFEKVCNYCMYRVNSEFVNDLESTRLFVKMWTTQHKKFLHSKIRAI